MFYIFILFLFLKTSLFPELLSSWFWKSLGNFETDFISEDNHGICYYYYYFYYYYCCCYYYYYYYYYGCCCSCYCKDDDEHNTVANVFIIINITAIRNENIIIFFHRHRCSPPHLHEHLLTLLNRISI